MRLPKKNIERFLDFVKTRWTNLQPEEEGLSKKIFLQKEFDKKIKELASVNKLLVKLSGLKSKDILLDSFSAEVINLLHCEGVLTFTKDEESPKFYCNKAAGISINKINRVVFSPSKDLVFDEINRLKQPLILQEKELKVLLPSIKSKTQLKNALFIPLLAGDEVFGLLCCLNKKNGFNDDDITIMQMIAPQIRALLQNVLLIERMSTKTADLGKFNSWLKRSRKAFTNILEDINQANNNLEKALHQTLTMYKIAVELSKSLDEKRLLQIIMINSADLVGAKSGCLILAKGSKLQQARSFNYEEELPLQSQNTPIHWINNKKKPLIINDFRKTHYRGYKLRANIKNFLGVPLIISDRSLGVLALFDKRGGFSRADSQNLVTLAHQATVTLINARVHENEKRTVAKLRELDKMKADFVASVSHELRSPLTTIKGYLDLLAEGEAGPITKEQIGFLNIIDKSSGRLLNLINDLLTVSRIESATLKMNKQMISVNSVLEKLSRVMTTEAKQKGLTLKAKLAKNLPAVEADPERVEQVVINLISNAIKFTPRGGSVELRSEIKDGVLIGSVKDTGLGISASDQRRLFDKFFRSQDAISKHIKGTGLGLAIAKGIIDQHQGKIWLESQPGKGSTFFFSLPIKNKAAA